MVGSDCQRGQAPSFLTTMLRGGTGNEVERKERGIGEYGREEGRERNMGIWQSGGKIKEYANMPERRKREQYWNMAERREERGI